MIVASLLLMSSITAIAPVNINGVSWEMSEQALQNSVKVEMAASGDGHGHGYSDFMEVNPVVYIDDSATDKKIEYYFHNNKLYKTFVIYLNQENPEAYYQQKTIELEKSFGEVKNQYTDELFSMPIQHRVWENDFETLDLRFGAGYVYEVRTFKKLAKEKHLEFELKHAI